MSPDANPSRDFPEAILLAAEEIAAEEIGSDGEGTDGVIGYFSRIARLVPDLPATLLEGFLAADSALDGNKRVVDLSPPSGCAPSPLLKTSRRWQR
jgi:hypothetical protein